MIPGELTLGELLAATRLMETNLLAFHFACITCDKAGLGQRGLQRCIVFDQGTDNAVTDGASLSGCTAYGLSVPVRPTLTLISNPLSCSPSSSG